MKKTLLSITLVVIGVATIAAGVLTFGEYVSAADARNYNAGRIIDDAVFTNSDSMTPQDIQNFLNSKVTCDTYGSKTSELGGGTRAQWMNARGITAPFRCVTDYYENVSNGQNNYGKNDIPAGAISAAQIIYNYSKQFNINPQVIIVTLQKENGLITDEWPTPTQYNQAMGFGCPDNVAPGAPACDPTYGSFSAQVYQAARHFRGYLNSNPGWWIPFNTGVNQILWNVASTGCGSGPVNIENRATVALYSYTTYQPNQAAKNAQYGRGDGCSAYGNRNFYLYFTDWFGSTYSPAFSAQPVYQQVYTDASKATALGWNADLMAGQTAYAVVVMKNTGNTTWTRSGAFGTTDTRLVTYGPWGRSSAFCGDGWTIPCSRPAALKEASVAPGESGTFEFTLRAPNSPGNYSEPFSLVVDGRTVFTNGVMVFNFSVKPATFSAQPVWQQVYTDASKVTSLGWDATLLAGQTAHVVVGMKNTGNVTWTKSGAFASTDTRLATYGSWGRSSSFCGAGWVIGCTRPAALREDSVAPGATGTFEFAIQAPNTPGNYAEQFSPVVDGRTTFTSGVMTFNFKVNPAIFSAQPVYQQVYTDASKATALGWNADLMAGQTAYAVVVMKNTGNTTWTRSGAFGTTDTRLVTYGPWGRSSAFCGDGWTIPCSRPAALKEASVAPGESGTFEFTLRAPNSPGNYSEPFSLVVDGRTVFTNGVMNFMIKVTQ